jgi:phage major head subunit gpT-like protein
MNEFSAWLVAKGFDPNTLTADQKSALQAAWRAETNPVATNPTPAPAPTPTPATTPATSATSTPVADGGFEAELRAIERENERIEYIKTRSLAALRNAVGDKDKCSAIRTLCDSAILDKKTDKRDFDLGLMRLDRGSGPLVFTPAVGPELTNDILEAAVCRAGGLKTLEKEYDDRTLSAVDKRFRGGMGLQELVGMCAKQNGWRGTSVRRDLSGALKAAFRGDAAADLYGGAVALGPSTLSVSGILSNTANKFLREAFMFVESEWRKITATRNVSDFKTITSYSLTGDNEYKKLPPGGQIEHGTLGNETYTNAADTYARILGIDRRDWINDDLGAFAQVGRRLGRGGALKINDVFWTEFMADASTFYTSGRGNYDDGTDTAFSNDGLVAADIIWQAKTDPDGKPLGATAKFLVLPPAHKIPAWRLMNSMAFGTTGEEGERNPWAGKFEVVVSNYLANSNYTGYSAVAWYMLADPNDIPVIETAFLDGVEMPTVETVELDADRLGVAMRAYWDFGVNKQEYRGALKLKGEA